MENKGELEERPWFVEGYKKALFGLAENHPPLQILKIDEVDPQEFGHKDAWMMHRIEFADHSKISVMCGPGWPTDKNLLDHPLLGGKKPNYPFITVEYRILTLEAHPNKRLLREFEKLLSPVLSPAEKPSKPSSLDELVYGEMYVRKDTGHIPPKVGISDARELVVSIHQPLYLFWGSHIETRRNLKDYMAVWVRSIKRVIPKVDRTAKEWGYK
ncbi:MAG: hypothetical protein WBD86_00085 [Microgenomates group bacterium]